MSISAWTGHPRLEWLQALREPQLALQWQLADWDRLIRLARRLRLLARLAASLQAAGLTERVPAEARRHLLAEQRLSEWRAGAMVWALQRVRSALGPPAYPCVLLKGAAYMGQGLAIAAGRLPSDADILVPRAYLDNAQQRLLAEGWQELDLDAHDQLYYREWSHEVPPMRHPQHSIELDLHHNILPPVARTRVDADLLLAELRPSNWPGWMVLQPVDQILHSAAHLFLDSEARDRLRDLVDLDGLLRHFAVEPVFFDRLTARARQLGLGEPLALACDFCVRWLGTPIPVEHLAAMLAIGPQGLRRATLLRLWQRVLMPSEPDEPSPWQQDMAAMALLTRYHRQRMPLRLLLPHVWHKWRSRNESTGSVPAADAPN